MRNGSVKCRKVKCFIGLSALYITISHENFKICFYCKNDRQRYKFWVTNELILSSTQWQTKSATQKTKSSVCWSSLSIVYLSSSEGTFVNILSAPLWEQDAPLSLPIFSYTPKRQSLYKNLSKTYMLQTLKHLMSHSGILMMFC